MENLEGNNWKIGGLGSIWLGPSDWSFDGVRVFPAHSAFLRNLISSERGVCSFHRFFLVTQSSPGFDENCTQFGCLLWEDPLDNLGTSSLIRTLVHLVDQE